MSEHSDYVKFIQQSVESLCPYEDEQRRRLYHAGFLASYLAALLEKDPWYLKQFKQHVELARSRQRRR